MADRSVRVRLLAEVQQYREGLRQATQATAEFGREVAANTSKSNDFVRDVGRGAMITGGALLAGFGVAANAAMGFEQQLSNLGAVAGATAEDMDLLRQAALDAGRDTVFSASEAATAQTELAKAGVSTTDILNGGLSGALDLAAAGNLDLARAAEIAAGAMTTFGLEGSDVGRIADALAAGANKSAADVDDMAQAMQQSALVADQLGISMEETVGTLAMFAQNGLRGSDAGTSFKTMLQRLVPQSADAAETMEQLGIDFFDAQGRFVGLDEAAQELQDGLGSLSEEQRTAAMTTMFGSDAIRAATIFYEGGADGVRDWTGAVSDSGYAAELAEQKMDNLAGDLEALKGSIETALIQGGSQATDVLRFFTQGATDAVNAISGLPGPVQGVGMAFAGIGGTALLAAGGIGTAIVKIRDLRTNLDDIGPAGARANRVLGSLGRIGGYATGIAAAAGALTILHGALEDVFTEDAPKVDDLTLALLDFADTGHVSGAAAQVLGEDLRGLNDDLHLLHERRGGFHIDLAEDFDEAVGRIDAFDKALAGLVESGHAEIAAQLIRDLGFAPEGALVTEELNDYTSALSAAEVQSRLTGDAAGELGPAIAGTSGPLEDAAQKADDAADALQNYLDTVRGVTDPMFALVHAQRRNADSQRDVNRAIQARNDAEAELNRLTHDPDATDADRARAAEALVDATFAISDAQLDAVESAGDLETAQLDLTGQIELGTTSVGQAQEALARWADQGYITTEQAMLLGAELADVATAADELHGKEIELVLGIATDPALAALDRFYAQVEKYAQRNQIFLTTVPGLKQSTGGLVPDVGRGAGDTVPALLTPGEFTVRAPAVAAVGLDFMRALNRADQGALDFAGASWMGGGAAGWSGAGPGDAGSSSSGDFYDVDVHNYRSADEGAEATVRETRRAKLLRAGR